MDPVPGRSTLRSNRLVLLLSVLLAVGIAAGSPIEAPSALIRIEPSQTWVGIARVHLDVGELRLANGKLEGDYSIRVPLRPSKNDTGRIHLAAPPWEQIRPGTALYGHANSTEDGKRRGIVCSVESDAKIVIEITTDERVLSFHSRYNAVRPADPS